MAALSYLLHSNYVEELQEDGTLEENTSTLCVETYEDVDYVEGCWRTDKHQELVEEGQDEITGRLLSKEFLHCCRFTI